MKQLDSNLDTVFQSFYLLHEHFILNNDEDGRINTYNAVYEAKTLNIMNSLRIFNTEPEKFMSMVHQRQWILNLLDHNYINFSKNFLFSRKMLGIQCSVPQPSTRIISFCDLASFLSPSVLHLIIVILFYAHAHVAQDTMQWSCSRLVPPHTPMSLSVYMITSYALHFRSQKCIQFALFNLEMLHNTIIMMKIILLQVLIITMIIIICCICTNALHAYKIYIIIIILTIIVFCFIRLFGIIAAFTLPSPSPPSSKKTQCARSNAACIYVSI